MQTIRWGILGAANFARQHMGPAIHSAEGAELVALATANSTKAQSFQAFCPRLKIHDSYDALLADPGIDAVYIPLPNHLHVEWVSRAIAAGKHVLCEKPIALEAGQIDQLIAARDHSGLMVAEAFMILHHPQWLRARDLLQSGEIGDLVHADAVFSYALGDMGNIRNQAATGGGSLRDIGVYTMGSMRFVTGAEPLADSMGADFTLENGVDSFAHVWGRMQGAKGAAFTFSSTTSMRAYKRQSVTFQGSKGMIRLDGGCFNAGVNDIATLELHQNGNRVTVDRWPAVNQYKAQVEAFGAAVRDRAGYICPLEFSRGTQNMMDLAFKLGLRA